jgi:hypothetical protein
MQSLFVWGYIMLFVQRAWKKTTKHLLMGFPGSRKSRKITRFLSQRTVHITLPAEVCVLNCYFDGEFICRHSMDCLFDSGSKWWHHVSSPMMMRSSKLSTSTSYWFNWSWQSCIRCSLCSCVSIRGTHLGQTLRYSNVATIVSNALKPIFSSVHSSLVVIRRFARMSWLRRSSFRGMRSVHVRPERGLIFTSLSPLLKRATYRLTVLTSTVWSP